MKKSNFLIAVCLLAFVVLEASVFMSPAFAVNTHNACPDAPGHTGSNPGQSGDNPGHGGMHPGHGSMHPGHSGNTPGHCGTHTPPGGNVSPRK